MLRLSKIQEKNQEYQWGKVPKQFIWNSTSTLDFKHAFYASFIEEKIDYLTISQRGLRKPIIP